MKSCVGSSVTELIQFDNGRLGGCLMEGIAVGSFNGAHENRR